MQPRLLEIRQDVLSKNDEIARRLRNSFTTNEVLAVNFVSSPGSGKTALLQVTIKALTGIGYRVGTLVGDLATDNDAQRLAAAGAPVRQITTGGNCHLEASMIETYLGDWDISQFDFLFIENVGNLVCPSSYDLGEAIRVVILSVTEGEDKPLKYPPIFHSSDIAIITKIDLAEAVSFDRAAAYESMNAVRPGLPILEVSAKTGVGIETWIDTLIERHRALVTAHARYSAYV